MSPRKVIALAILACGLSPLMLGQAQAGLLLTTPYSTSALPGFNGMAAFGDVTPPAFSAEVDYAVYAPGVFGPLFSATDPSGGTDYVYLYQVHNVGSVASNNNISQLSVGMGDVDNNGAEGQNLGHLQLLGAGDNGIDPGGTPTYSFFTAVHATNPHTSAVWTFTTDGGNAGTIPESLSGEILIFTSSKPPEMHQSTVKAGILVDSGLLPSPIPEPATGMVLSGVLLAAASIRRRR